MTLERARYRRARFHFRRTVVQSVAMRTLNRCTLIALAAGLTAAPRLDAQDTLATTAQQQPRTHTVVRGDNLWDLAQTYLGNPFLWPEIYRLNRDVVEDPHWIYPGEILRLPGPEVPAVAVIPDTTGIAVPQPPTLPVQQPVDPESETVFTRRYATAPVTPSVSGGASPGMINAPEKPTVRWGEVISAPY